MNEALIHHKPKKTVNKTDREERKLRKGEEMAHLAQAQQSRVASKFYGYCYLE